MKAQTCFKPWPLKSTIKFTFSLLTRKFLKETGTSNSQLSQLFVVLSENFVLGGYSFAIWLLKIVITYFNDSKMKVTFVYI